VTDRHVVVDHVLFVVEDFPASRRLYTAALAPLGIEELNEEPNCVSYGRQDLDDFSICEGSPVTTASHVAFDAADRGSVDAFFEAALAAGASARGEPGVWIQYSNRYYAAFINDLHLNNVEAVFHSSKPITEAPERGGVP
jgi:catechol 2,3-dioxygenase-like lactoylglutathione lyase family enzyme